MSDESGPVEDLAGEGSKVVVAGTAALWPYKKLMLAVLPPTLALLIAVVGVWESNNRDRAAAAQAEQDRVAEAIEAEKVRGAEVASEQAATKKERQLREAELVLPRYENLLTEVRALTNAAGTCRDELDGWLNPGVSGWNDAAIGTAAQALSTGESGEVVAPDEPFLTSCEAIGDPLALETAVDRALIISNPDLEDAAIHLDALLRRARHLAQHLSEAPRQIAPDGTILITSGDDLDGNDFRDNVQALKEVIDDVGVQTVAMIDVVRGVLLRDE